MGTEALAPMVTAADIEAALSPVIPAGLHSHLPGLAHLLAGVANRTLSAEAAQIRVAAEPHLGSLLDRLNGQAIKAGPALISCVQEERGSRVTISSVQDNSVLAVGKNSVAVGGDVVNSAILAGKVEIISYGTPSTISAGDLEAAQQLLRSLPAEAVPEAYAPLPAMSRVPAGYDRLFIGRRDELRRLAGWLKGHRLVIIGQAALAAGEGGTGKTALAFEFTRRYGHYFAGGVFWLNFANPAAAAVEVAACGGPGGLNLQPPDFDSLPQAGQVELVKAAWQSPLPRLLVFDGCETEALLDKWRPPTGGCRVLVTGRRSAWDPILGARVLPLDVLPRADSIALLRRFRPDLSPADPVLDAVAARLKDVPGALRQAGTTLRRYRYDLAPAEYLDRLKDGALL